MKRTFAIILLLASVARADVGAIDSNAPLPQTPTRYVVVALPQGWQQDEESLSLLRLKQEPIEGASTYFFWPENPNWEDWRHRFAPRIPDDQLPVVLGMVGRKVTFKKSDCSFEDLAGGVGGRRLFPRLFPDCPDNDCPTIPPQDEPYPDVGPDLQPIPDTPDAPLPDTQPIPDTQPGPDLELLSVIADLKVRVELLEARVAEPGPPGPKGDKGDTGPAGKDGKDGKDAVFDLNAVVAEVQKRLTHSLEVTLLSGQKQFQTRPLTEPLQINQRTVSAKP